MSACAVVTSRSFIVALFTYSDVMLTCWKVAFFLLLMLTVFLDPETPLFLERLYCCLCRLRSHLKNHLRKGSLLGLGPRTDADMLESGMKT